jgi:hypothetical protein
MNNRPKDVAALCHHPLMTFDPSLLAGLDDVAWDLLEHAYGPATDVPEVLRALVSGDDELADEAMYELYGNIWHQGSVYPATIPAVPYLVAIAVARAAGKQTPEVLRLLGYIAASRDPRGVEDRDAVRLAVAAHVDAIAGLLDDAEAKTRAAVLFVLVYAGLADDVRPLITERWHTDVESLPRAEALNALMRVDPDAAADLADEALSAAGWGDSPDDAVLRVSCALAWIRAGGTMDERMLDAALTPIPEGSGLWYWNDDGELFDQLINKLAERHGAPASVELLAEALGRSGQLPAGQARRYLYAASQLIMAYRSVPRLLAVPIARLLERPELSRDVIAVLELIEPALVAAVARNRLIELAQADATPQSDEACLADNALACLARWNDPSVSGLLARALVERPQTLDIVAKPDAALPFDAELLEAIRRRLNEICDAAQEPSAESGNPFIDVQNRAEPGQLVRVLTAWGDLAAPAVPELLRLLQVRPAVAAPLVAALPPPSLEGMAQLRRIAATAEGGDAVYVRLAAARAIRTLTQDAGPLLAAVEFGLCTESKNPDDRSPAAEAATELPNHADVLAPLLLQALADIPVPTPSLPAHQARITIGRALWLLTGRPEHAIEVLRSTLGLAGEMFTAWKVATAADVAAEIGPAARELVPALEAALADPVSCPAAARALLAVDLDGPWATSRREELTDLLFGVLVAGASSVACSRAVDVLATLTPLPAASAEKLRAIAEADERFPIRVLDAEHLHGDDVLQSRIRTLLRG